MSRTVPFLVCSFLFFVMVMSTGCGDQPLSHRVDATVLTDQRPVQEDVFENLIMTKLKLKSASPFGTNVEIDYSEDMWILCFR